MNGMVAGMMARTGPVDSRKLRVARGGARSPSELARAMLVMAVSGVGVGVGVGGDLFVLAARARAARCLRRGIAGGRGDPARRHRTLRSPGRPRPQTRDLYVPVRDVI